MGSHLDSPMRRLRGWGDRYGGRLAIACAAFLFVLTFAAITAPLILPYGINEFVGDPFQTPTWQHILGTDDLGRDMLTRILYGARASLLVGLSAATLGTILGTAIGIVSGYIGGVVDATLQRILEAFMAFPLIVAALALVAIVDRPSLDLLIVAIGAVIFPRVARIVRGVVLGLRETEYVMAARSIGARTLRIMVTTILPNVLPYVIVLVTILLGNAILVEAALSFLGYGVQPPTPSWGGMLSGSVRTHMFHAPWLVVPPGLALSMTVFATNIVGDTLRDALDPRMRIR